ncbi:MAG: flagellar biosynthetic protein FliR [Pseudomonadota bacterium]
MTAGVEAAFMEGGFAAVALGAARTVPLTWLVPALAGPRVPPYLRVGLGLLLAVLCLPLLQPELVGAFLRALSPLQWVILAARESLVGITVGLCTAAAFRAAEAAGRLVGTFSGSGALPADDGDEGPSPTADLYLFLVVVLFLEMGGLGLLVGGLARSYQAIPLATPPSAAALRPAAELVVAATAKLLESALGLAAPVLVASWMADGVLGLVGRAAPQIPMYFIAMPAKALLGLGVVLVGVGAFDAAWTAGFPAWGALIERATAVWRPR